MYRNKFIAKYRREKRALVAYGIVVIIVGATGAFFYSFDFIQAVIDAIDAAGRAVESATGKNIIKPEKTGAEEEMGYELTVLVTGMLEVFWLLIVVTGLSIIRRRSWSLNAAWICGLASILVLAIKIMETFPPRLSPSMAIPPILIIPPCFPFLRRSLRPGIGYGEDEL